jgi:catechol 2,3-dioxygenase-like lactoylglutathione lyase family enzyme
MMVAVGGMTLAPARGINHVAFRCRDAEQTRWFYGDVLGLPLAAALVADEVPGLGDRIPYMHLFFELGNGEYVAFFDQPETASEEQFARAHSFDRHLALEVASEDELLAWQKRINGQGVSCLGPVDHGFVKSVYMYDPNGLQVELTCRTDRFDSIMAAAGADASAMMSGWSERYRTLKEEKFGKEAIDRRARR